MVQQRMMMMMMVFHMQYFSTLVKLIADASS